MKRLVGSDTNPRISNQGPWREGQREEKMKKIVKTTMGYVVWTFGEKTRQMSYATSLHKACEIAGLSKYKIVEILDQKKTRRRLEDLLRKNPAFMWSIVYKHAPHLLYTEEFEEVK